MAKEQDLAAEKLEKLKVLQAAISKIEKNYGKECRSNLERMA